MIKYALFLGCNIPARVSQYEDSSKAVLKNLSVDLIEMRDFSCCGYPMRNIDEKAYILSAAKNLALAEKQGINILTLCQCCFGSLKKAECLLKEDSDLRQDINQTLADIGLKYEGNITVKHLLSVLYHDVGIDAIKGSLSGSYKDLKIAAHYGCHALRPSKITQFDDPVAPTIFDELVEITGAVSIDWPKKLECCGAPLRGINDEVSIGLTKKKVSDAGNSGADYLCTACPFCHLQFDFLQKRIVSDKGNSEHLAPVLYPQLLGLCMGIDKKTLGIGKDLNGLMEIINVKR
ncbi:MAG: heterodisulfide reductase subunit B2 [Desulfobacteraceae bacterium Eth-SRB1]|nr:MAG: heterodisulfide reductase subunit B2 [Desulfobacteraceae bacterium Eth-SRB1]